MSRPPQFIFALDDLTATFVHTSSARQTITEAQLRKHIQTHYNRSGSDVHIVKVDNFKHAFDGLWDWAKNNESIRAGQKIVIRGRKFSRVCSELDALADIHRYANSSDEDAKQT